MKKTKEIIISIILVIICIIVASIFNKKDYKIKYTFFYRNNNSIYMLDSYGRKVLKEELDYVSKNNNGYYLIVNTDKKSAIIDEQGNFIINYDEYDTIEEYGKLYIAYKDNDIYLITRNNKIVRKVEKESELVSKILKNYSVVLFDNKYHICDDQGNVIKELEYNKKKKISLKETDNYAQVFYSNKEYVFALTTYEIIEIDTKEVSNMKETDGILTLTDENDEIIYESSKLSKNDDLSVTCTEKCSLYRGKESILKNYDEIYIKETNLNKYIVTVKGKETTVLNDEFKTIFKTKKSVKLDTNFMEIGGKNYTFEGFIINL